MRFAVSLYSDIADIHDSITKVRGSWHQTVKALQAIKKYGYRIRVATVLMKHNQNSLEGLEQLCQQLDLQCGYPDIVRSTGRGSEELKPTLSEICSLRVLKSPNFYTNKTLFKNALHWNSCWAGKVAITPAGDVLPCIFARELAIGSLKHTSFKNILQSEKLLSFWHLTKDSISICKDCEYRYACRDCRPMASADTGNLFIRGNHCLYNPYTGYWNIQGDNNEQSISGDSFDNAEPN